MVYAVQTIRAS